MQDKPKNNNNKKKKPMTPERKAMLDERSRQMNPNPPHMDTHFIITITNGNLVEIKTQPSLRTAIRYANAMLLDQAIALNYNLKRLLEIDRAELIEQSKPIKKAWLSCDDGYVRIYVTKLRKSCYDDKAMIEAYNEYMAAK